MLLPGDKKSPAKRNCGILIPNWAFTSTPRKSTALAKGTRNKVSVEGNGGQSSEPQRNARLNFGSRSNSSYAFWEKVDVVEVVSRSGRAASHRT